MRIAFVQLDDQRDSIKWSLSKLGSFTVQSMYKHLVNQLALPLNKSIWKLKIPLKIKVFIGFLLKGVILTKDNLLRRRWKGDDRCCFCDNKENIQHILFLLSCCEICLESLYYDIWFASSYRFEDLSGVCFQQTGQHMRSLICVGTSAILWSIWICRNDVTFDKKKLYSYLQVIF